LVGFSLSLGRLAVDTPRALKFVGFENGYKPGSLLYIVNETYFQYFSLLIFLVSAVVMVVVSLATAPPNPDQLRGLTCGWLLSEDLRQTRAGGGTLDVVGTLVVLGLIASAYIYFSG